jgi:hypothetical protein
MSWECIVGMPVGNLAAFFDKFFEAELVEQ